ncbi:MAG: 4-hydroxy-3-methylbut-2-enyl diphosphate reductase [Planctomycetota bacterium]
MKIRLARDVGFCWGVKRALDLALKSSASAKKVYTYGPLIHNQNVVEMLKTKGVEPFSRRKSRSPGRTLLLIRAHGVPPPVRDKLSGLGYGIIDATCPHVKKSQKMVGEYANRGYQIIIAGDKEHAEVISLVGYARAIKRHPPVIVVSSTAEAQEIVKEARRKLKKKICILAQSTFQPRIYYKIVTIIKSKIPADIEMVVLDTICQAPARRQGAVKDLSKEVDAIVVVGDHKSANTTNLTLLARSMKIPAFQVASAAELPTARLKKYKSIGISTGTSTPDWLIKEVVDKLSQL